MVEVAAASIVIAAVRLRGSYNKSIVAARLTFASVNVSLGAQPAE
jgi:hypothetical protein